VLEALHCRWSTAFFRGNVTTALKDSREGIERYDQSRHSWMGAVFGGHDPGVCAHGVQAMNLCISGFVSQSKECIAQAVSLAESLNHPHTLAFVLTNVMVIDQIIGDPEAVHRVGQRLIAFAEKYNFPPQRAHALLLCGWARTMGADPEAGLELMEAEYPRASAIGPFFRYYAAI